MADAKLSALTAASALTDPDILYVVQGANSRKVSLLNLQNYASAPIADHLAEVDPHVHTASKVLYDGTVAGAADVQAAIDTIHAESADPAAFQAALDTLTERVNSAEAMLGGNLFSTNPTFEGVGTRAQWTDDFFTHQDGETTGTLTSGKVGEKGWMKGGAAGGTIAAIATPAASRPGAVELSSGTAVGNASMYASSAFVPSLSFFEYHMHWRPMASNTNVAYRVGLSDAVFTDATGGETPSNAIMFEKQAADTVWNISTVLGGTATRVATATPITANVWVHVRIRRTTTTSVVIDYNVHTGGVPSPTWSTATTVAFAPAGVFMRPYGSVRTNLVGTAYQAQYDRASVLLTELNR